MGKHRDELLDDTCWLYVMKDKEDNYIIAITYKEGLRQQKEAAGHKLLLWRKFNDIFSAAGYRIALLKLSRVSLQEVLKRHNTKNNIMQEK